MNIPDMLRNLELGIGVLGTQSRKDLAEYVARLEKWRAEATPHLEKSCVSYYSEAGHAIHTCWICDVKLLDDTAQYRKEKRERPHTADCLLHPTNLK